MDLSRWVVHKLPRALVGMGVGLTFGIEMVATASSAERSLFWYLGPAFTVAPRAGGVSVYAYQSAIWGLKHIEDYTGPFYSLQLGMGMGVAGAGVSVFWNRDFTTHGVATGLTLGNTGGAVSFGGTMTEYYMPLGEMGIDHGYSAVWPYLATAWPFFWAPALLYKAYTADSHVACERKG